MKIMTLKALIFFFIANFAFADIVFIDTNNNPLEIKTAQDAAKRRGERLIVISRGEPKDQNAVRKNRELQSEYDRLANQNSFTDEQITRIYQITEEMENLKSQLGDPVSKDMVSAKLRELRDQGVNVSSIVVSGHDGNGHFGGSQGDISSRQLKSAIEENPPIGEGIRSLFLAGCYTGNQGTLAFDWKPIAPNINVIGGYDGSAPLGDRPAGHTYMHDFLVKEQELSAARDEKALNRLFKNLKGANMLHAAICVDDKLVSHQGVKEMADYSDCSSFAESGELRAAVEKIECYRSASPGCENLPATSNGELRQIYNKLQDKNHCSEYYYRSGQGYLPSTAKLIRLIYGNKVTENFEKLYKSELNRLNEYLDEIGVEKSLRYKDLSTLSRKDLISLSQGILQESSKKCQSIEVLKKSTGACEALAQDAMSINHYVIDPSEHLPFSWVEPDSRDKLPLEFVSSSPRSNKMSANSAYGLAMAYYGNIERMVPRDSQGNPLTNQIDNSLIQRYLRQEEQWIRRNMQFDSPDTEQMFFKYFNEVKKHPRSSFKGL